MNMKKKKRNIDNDCDRHCKKNRSYITMKERSVYSIDHVRSISCLFFFYQDVTRGNVTKRSAVTSCFLSIGVRRERGAGHFSN